MRKREKEEEWRGRMRCYALFVSLPADEPNGMEQNNSKIIPTHNPDEKPSVVAILKKVCEFPATPAPRIRGWAQV